MCEVQELCKPKNLFECQEIAEDTIKSMEEYSKLYDANGTIENFCPQLEIMQDKLTHLKESIKQAIKVDDFIKYAGLKKKVKE
jgi:cell fate (sporulation/competence/biofilm development) regulator YlbF (YheA/YmcA/DUF963 family)